MTTEELLKILVAAQQLAIRLQELLLDIRAQLPASSGEVIDAAATAHETGADTINEVIKKLERGDANVSK